MNDIENMFATLAAGFIFLAVMVGSGIGLWYALTYNHIVTIALVAVYGLVQFLIAYRKYPKQGLRNKWFLFWFDNEWYKLVLLLTGLWSLATWA